MIVSATLQQLQTAAGKAHTAGGALLPMGDLLRMASHAYHYLSIFDGQGRALWLGRTKRLASADQRIVLHARDRGCTRPGCTVPGYLSQAHHLDNDWARNGQTDIDSLALACAPDNRMASEQGWTTRLGDHGRVEWIPPPKLDHGQPRINPFHFIEAVIDYHQTVRRRKPTDDLPEPQPPPPGWPDLDEPQPGEPGYDEAFESLCRSYDTIDYDELAKRHWPDDDWGADQLGDVA